MEYWISDKAAAIGSGAKRFLKHLAFQVALSAAVVTGLHFTTVGGMPFDVWMFGPLDAAAGNRPAAALSLPPAAPVRSASLPVEEAAATPVAMSLPAAGPASSNKPSPAAPAIVPPAEREPQGPVALVRDTAPEQGASPVGQKPKQTSAAGGKPASDAAAPAELKMRAKAKSKAGKQEAQVARAGTRPVLRCQAGCKPPASEVASARRASPKPRAPKPDRPYEREDEVEPSDVVIYDDIYDDGPEWAPAWNEPRERWSQRGRPARATAERRSGSDEIDDAYGLDDEGVDYYR